jgi:hypothetical protein
MKLYLYMITYLNSLKQRYMARNYENGYLPKIEYWQYKLNKAVQAFDTEGVTYAAGKLAYFVDKQNSTYGGPLKGDAFLRSVGVI